MLSVRELIRELDVRPIAGAAGLDRAVRWVHISELLDPTPFLSGGELLLTTGLQLSDDATQREFVARLAGAGLSGLGLGTGLVHEDVPPALAEAAEGHGFPLLEVPYEVPFIAVTERAATHLVNEHYALLQRAISAHERLERVVLSERGLDGLAAALADLVGGSALILDGRGEPLASHGPVDDSELRDLAHEVRARVRAGGAAELPGDGLALPVVRAQDNGAAPEAWLVARKQAGPLGELDRLVLHQAVTIVGLELLRRRVAEQTERRLAGDILAGMLSGELEGVDLARRLEPFGLRDRAAVVLLSPPRQAQDAADDLLGRFLAEESLAGLVGRSGTYVCAVLAPPASGDAAEEALFALAERLRARVAHEVDLPLAAGAGRPVALGDLRLAFHEARCALEARTLVASSDEAPLLATYRDLGSFQLLLSLQDDEALRLFCDSILAPIERSEGAYGGELMRSLETFIECNGQWERAAKRLYCHRHTLRYRIRRVEELTGRSLDSARDRIDFWLALRGRELVR